MILSPCLRLNAVIASCPISYTVNVLRPNQGRRKIPQNGQASLFSTHRWSRFGMVPGLKSVLETVADERQKLKLSFRPRRRHDVVSDAFRCCRKFRLYSADSYGNSHLRRNNVVMSQFVVGFLLCLLSLFHHQRKELRLSSSSLHRRQVTVERETKMSFWMSNMNEILSHINLGHNTLQKRNLVIHSVLPLLLNICLPSFQRLFVFQMVNSATVCPRYETTRSCY